MNEENKMTWLKTLNLQVIITLGILGPVRDDLNMIQKRLDDKDKNSTNDTVSQN